MGYILFNSENIINLSAVQLWDGIIEYSYDNKEWFVWRGENIINNTIYMRGINNTIVSDGISWDIEGKNIKCQGNIENLLDYKSVINNVHPKMNSYCFSYMFHRCNALIETPQLSSIELSEFCYSHMFDCCTSLKQSSVLIDAQLSKGSYEGMFLGCTSLITSPLLMVKSSTQCYHKMFDNCISLRKLPSFLNLSIAKETIINQHIFSKCLVKTFNINNKTYDVEVLRLL